MKTLTLDLPETGCSGGGGPGASTIKARASGGTPGTNVVIDTDMGRDDVMAILYLLQRPDVNVEAITVAGTGIAHCEPGKRNARGLAALAGADDIPVACGREKPLQGDNAFPTGWRHDADALEGLALSEADTASDQNAVELLTSTIGSSPHKMVLLTLGPLTNVAEALQRSPQLVNNLEMIYIMGGAVDVPGNIIKNSVAEWNIWVDPHAANLVLESGAPITLVPLDATNYVPVTVFFHEALKNNHDTPEATAVFDLFTGNPSIYQGGSYFWDQLAAAILTDESLATFETRRLSVVEEGREKCGHTKMTEDGSEVRVSVSVDALHFEQEFLSTLNGGGDVTIPRFAVDMTITFDGSECTYDGPRTVSVGQVTATLENRGQEVIGLTIGTLDEGKTVEDLEAWEYVEKPPWFQLVAFADAPPHGQPTWILDMNEGIYYMGCLAFESKREWGLGSLRVGD